MNKKGALFHWIIFGILAALGLFFVLVTDIEVKGVKGDWQLDFLENYYLEAEKDLVKIDQAARYAGWQSVLALGEKGGFVGKSDCGELNEENLWNELEEWCAVDIGTNVLAKVKEKLGDHSEIRLEGENLIGKGKKKSIVSLDPYVKYTYDTNFKVDLGFNVKEEYETLFFKAVDLVNACRNSDVLKECVEEKVDWKECDEWEFVETGRKVIFCVEGDVEVYGEEGLTPVRYQFALDFSEEE